MSRLQLVTNAAMRRLETMFPGFFADAKHNHYRDFGYPEQLSFNQIYAMYQRNGFARAAVDKTIGKTWETNPELWENEEPKKTKIERDLADRFSDLRVWQRIAETDRRSLVGGYAGLILRFADSKPFDQPVDRVTGGLLGLVEVIPAWAGQLTVASWETDQRSENYGQPTMYRFNEAQLPNTSTNVTTETRTRTFQLHPDRVILWSADGTVHAESLLAAGYNDLLTMEKVVGSGGEGFWKNAKSAPVLSIDKEATIQEMARNMGVEPEDVADAMNEQVNDWQKGFDKLLMLQGMKAETLGITLPQPQEFFEVALQGFAASINIPLKILVGNQTGERASTEDARDWAQVNMSRRNNSVVPNIHQFVNRLERVGVIPQLNYVVGWPSLLETTMGEKIERADKMATINQKMGLDAPFLPEEIRDVVDMQPLTEAQMSDREGDLA